MHGQAGIESFLSLTAKRADPFCGEALSQLVSQLEFEVPMNVKQKYVVGGVGLSLCVLLLSGCGGPAVKFNNAIAMANKKLADVGQEFGVAVGEVLAGQQSSMTKVKASYDKLKKTMSDVKAEMKNLTIPSSASAQKLYDSHQRFLKGEEEFVTMFGQVVQILEDSKLNANTKRTKVEQILSQVAAKEKPLLADLQSTQREFAKENNIRLEQPK
jgi:hypothetical protein